MVTATITSENGASIVVSQFGVSVVHPEGITSIWARLTADQRRALAEALDPGRVPAWAVAPDGTPRVHPAPADQGGQWTADDLPSEVEKHSAPGDWRDLTLSERRDLAVWLNTHHPKSAGESRWATAKRKVLLGALAAAERERDAAVERAKSAEKRHTWPKTTPTGHIYIAPDTYSSLCHQHGNAAQAAVESWDADECPPEPTWEMVGIAHREVERITGVAAELRRELIGETEKIAELMSENAQLRDKVSGIAPAVSRADIEKAIHPYVLDSHHFGVLADAVWAVVRGDDPAAFVIHQSEIEAAPVRRRSSDSTYGGPGAWEATDETFLYSKGVDAAVLGEEIEANREGIVYALSVKRAIEAEQAVDPVQAKVTTRHPENYRLVNEADGSEWRMTRDGSWVAADSVGQEASSDE